MADAFNEYANVDSSIESEKTWMKNKDVAPTALEPPRACGT